MPERAPFPAASNSKSGENAARTYSKTENWIIVQDFELKLIFTKIAIDAMPPSVIDNSFHSLAYVFGLA